MPGCCPNGWKITLLAGSRFLKPAESKYAPVEGEALAIAWALEHSKYFTQGCDNLLIITDHKPLVKLFGDRTLDEISNPRLFRLKQRTLMWRFDVEYMPGKSNHFSDATSQHPTTHEQDETPCISNSSILNCLCLTSDEEDDMEASLTSVAANSTVNLRAVTWHAVRQETLKDPHLLELISIIWSGIPTEKGAMPLHLQKYYKHRDQLCVIDGVLMMKNRIIIPQTLRQEVLESLHAARQGVSAMIERAKVTVYWPGISRDIQSARDNCSHCNRIAPSQARLPPVEPWIPTAPFEAVACDYFYCKGYYYFVAADRLSGWTEQSQIAQGTNESGGVGLCKALRKLFATFGVPTEISSDGGPEFVASFTKDFLMRWGVRHRISSSYFASSNGRAELAVKSTKRLLMANLGPNGSLDTEKMLRALLIQRNTPDSGCQLLPAQILFGRPIRDTLPYINKDVTAFSNPQFTVQWRGLWRSNEQTLRARYVKSLETLSEHCRHLSPLEVGDQVFIQNQSGQFPKRWDKWYYCGNKREQPIPC